MESEIATGELIKDNLKRWSWKTKENKITSITEMADSHLRNIALFLIGIGYQKCNISNETRIIWLSALRIEWQRRMLHRKHNPGRIIKWKAT